MGGASSGIPGPAGRADPAPAFLPVSFPSVDEVDFSDLYTLEEIPVDTEDGWRLVITRYRPRSQPFPQPLFGVPLLLVHGYTQNRRAWDAGEFVKTMAYFGADLFLLELRGHGKSSVEAQRRRARRDKAPLPSDLDYRWDLDSYVLYDLPAAVGAVKRASGRDRIFYCGHSLGGTLGYAYATLFDDLMGLATIGAPSDFRRMPRWIRLAGWIPPVSFLAVDLVASGVNLARFLSRAAARASGFGRPGRKFRPVRFDRVPFRALFKWVESNLREGGHMPIASGIPLRTPLLYQPRNVALGALRPLLREGANDEPRATAEQFARWLRRGELVCYRVRHDIAAAFPRIGIPLAIFFGDEDPFASVRTTRNVYRAVSSEYLLWRPVRGNSHLELTMGNDIRQICYEVKNLMTYALDHDGSRPVPQRRRRAPSRPRPS
jgi:pimeloyl-ACP methyl ester carboxylesterase